MVGLYNQSGRGSKPKFNSEQENQIKEWTKSEPRQLKQVVEKAKEKWGIEASTKTIKRILQLNICLDRIAIMQVNNFNRCKSLS